MPGITVIPERAPRLRLHAKVGSIDLGAHPTGTIVTLLNLAPRLKFHVPAVEVDQSTAVLMPAPRLRLHAGNGPIVNGAGPGVLDGCLFITYFDGSQDNLYGVRPKVWSVSQSIWLPVRVQVWSVAQNAWIYVPWVPGAIFVG